jgi:hypothetical protein
MANNAGRKYVDVRFQDASLDAATTVLGHACFRIDPHGGGGGSASGMIPRLVQGYKLSGTWDTKLRNFSGASAPGFPPLDPPGAAFWLRLLILPQGLALFVDGTLLNISPHPPNGSFGAAVEGGRLVLKLPCLGDAGELATWKVTRVWWGSCDLDTVDPVQARAVRAWVDATTAKSQNTAATLASTQLWITGVPDKATMPELLALLLPYGVTDVRKPESKRPGAAVATCVDSAAASAGLRSIEASGGLTLHGSVLQIVMGAAGRA